MGLTKIIRKLKTPKKCFKIILMLIINDLHRNANQVKWNLNSRDILMNNACNA
jgi:hypothetical protein